MQFANLDPSLALCFLSKTRAEFDELCKSLKSDIISNGSQPLFEITDQTQSPWQPSTSKQTQSSRDSDRGNDILTEFYIGY